MKEDYEAEVVETVDHKRARTESGSEASMHSTESDDDYSKRATDYEYDRDFVPSTDKRRLLSELDNTLKPKLRKRDKHLNDRDKNSRFYNETVTISDDDEDGKYFYLLRSVS